MSIKTGNSHERVADTEGGGSVRERFKQINREMSQPIEPQKYSEAQNQSTTKVRDDLKEMNNDNSV